MSEAGWGTDKPTEYVPRILRDDGMIAFKEVAHYTHLNLVKYVLASAYADAYAVGRVDMCILIRDIQKIRDSVENGIPPEHRPGFQRACNEIIALVRTYQQIEAQGGSK